MEKEIFTVQRAESYLESNFVLDKQEGLEDVELKKSLIAAYTELKEMSSKDFVITGSYGTYLLINDLVDKGKISSEWLKVWRERIEVGSKDIDFGVKKIDWQSTMSEDLNWNEAEISSHKGILPQTGLLVDIIDRNEYKHFLWRDIELDGTKFKVMTSEESLMRLLVTIGDNLVPEDKPKWFFDIMFLKEFIRIERNLDPDDLERYLSEQYSLFVEDKKSFNIDSIIEISKKESISLKDSFVKYVNLQINKELDDNAILDILIKKYGNYGVAEDLVKETFNALEEKQFAENFEKINEIMWRRLPSTYEEASKIVSAKYLELIGNL